MVDCSCESHLFVCARGGQVHPNDADSHSEWHMKVTHEVIVCPLVKLMRDTCERQMRDDVFCCFSSLLSLSLEGEGRARGETNARSTEKRERERERRGEKCDDTRWISCEWPFARMLLVLWPDTRGTSCRLFVSCLPCFSTPARSMCSVFSIYLDQCGHSEVNV